MSLSNADALAIKAELTNDPLNLGLTTASEDDEANANLLNAINPLILVDKSYVSVAELDFDRDEYGAISPADRAWIDLTTRAGSIDPGKSRDGFLSIFGDGTITRDALETAFKEKASRVRQLSVLGIISEGIYSLTPSDVAQARQAT